MRTHYKDILTRREFLRQIGILSSGSTALIGFNGLFSSCGSMPIAAVRELNPVGYPRLSGQKIQSPEHYGLYGCMVGYYNGKRRVGRPIKIDPEVIERYIRMTEKPPSVIYQPNPFYRKQPDVEFAMSGKGGRL